jgi:spermidine synthase
VLAARHRPAFGLAPDAPPLAGLSAEELRAGRRAETRERRAGLPASTLMHPRYLE